jgi:hypothetical protein
VKAKVIIFEVLSTFLKNYSIKLCILKNKQSEKGIPKAYSNSAESPEIEV